MQTIKGEDWSYVDDAALAHDGCVVDVGCSGWNWSNLLLGQKRVVGIDPLCGGHLNSELYRGILGPFTGEADLYVYEGSSSALMGDHMKEWPALRVPMISWKDFCHLYNIDKVSVLKLNVEGSEYSILHSLDLKDYAKIDQIAVSFHDFINPEWKALTKVSLGLLKDVGFELTQINKDYNWWHGKNLYISR